MTKKTKNEGKTLSHNLIHKVGDDDFQLLVKTIKEKLKHEQIMRINQKELKEKYFKLQQSHRNIQSLNKIQATKLKDIEKQLISYTIREVLYYLFLVYFSIFSFEMNLF